MKKIKSYHCFYRFTIILFVNCAYYKNKNQMILELGTTYIDKYWKKRKIILYIMYRKRDCLL